MISLNEEQVRRLNIGDEVIYKERSGLLSTHHYRATVIGKYPNFILLSCVANRFNNTSFNTCFCYDDGIELGGYKLYKESFEEEIDERIRLLGEI